MKPARPHEPYLLLFAYASFSHDIFPFAVLGGRQGEPLQLGLLEHREPTSASPTTASSGSEASSRRAFRNTLAYSAVVVAGALVLGLSLALLLDRKGRLAAFVRGAVFSAYVVSWVAWRCF